MVQHLSPAEDRRRQRSVSGGRRSGSFRCLFGWSWVVSSPSIPATGGGGLPRLATWTAMQPAIPDQIGRASCSPH